MLGHEEKILRENIINPFKAYILDTRFTSFEQVVQDSSRRLREKYNYQPFQIDNLKKKMSIFR